MWLSQDGTSCYELERNFSTSIRKLFKILALLLSNFKLIYTTQMSDLIYDMHSPFFIPCNTGSVLTVGVQTASSVVIKQEFSKVNLRKFLSDSRLVGKLV